MKARWILFLLLLTAPMVSLAAAAPGEKPGDCQYFAIAVRESQAATSNDLRQIKRDLARLEQKIDEPGIGQIVAGIGYIAGLFGVAAFVASRKKRGEK